MNYIKAVFMNMKSEFIYELCTFNWQILKINGHKYSSMKAKYIISSGLL